MTHADSAEHQRRVFSHAHVLRRRPEAGERSGGVGEVEADQEEVGRGAPRAGCSRSGEGASGERGVGGSGAEEEDVGAGGAGEGNGWRRLLHPGDHPRAVVGGILHSLLPRAGGMLRRGSRRAAHQRMVAAKAVN